MIGGGGGEWLCFHNEAIWDWGEKMCGHLGVVVLSFAQAKAMVSVPLECFI